MTDTFEIIASMIGGALALLFLFRATHGQDELRERVMRNRRRRAATVRPLADAERAVVRFLQRDPNAREITADELPEALACARAEMRSFSIDLNADVAGPMLAFGPLAIRFRDWDTDESMGHA